MGTGCPKPHGVDDGPCAGTRRVQGVDCGDAEDDAKDKGDMMQKMIKLELEDIVTRPCGGNIMITPPEAADGLWIILSPEAARELIADLQTVLSALPQDIGKASYDNHRD